MPLPIPFQLAPPPQRRVPAAPARPSSPSRRAVAEAALAVLAASDAGPFMDAVADAAGVSKGALYLRYPGGISALRAAALALVPEAFARALSPPVAGSEGRPDAEQATAALVLRALVHAHARPDHLRVLFSHGWEPVAPRLPSSPQPLLHEAVHACLVARFAQTYARAPVASQPPRLAAGYAAATLVGSLERLAYDARDLGRSPAGLRVLVGHAAEVTELICRGLAAPPDNRT